MDTKIDHLWFVLQVPQTNTFNMNRAFQVKDKGSYYIIIIFLNFNLAQWFIKSKYIYKKKVYGQCHFNMNLLFKVHNFL